MSSWAADLGAQVEHPHVKTPLVRTFVRVKLRKQQQTQALGEVY